MIKKYIKKLVYFFFVINKKIEFLMYLNEQALILRSELDKNKMEIISRISDFEIRTNDEMHTNQITINLIIERYNNIILKLDKLDKFLKSRDR